MDAKITLGGREYTVEDLPSRQNKPWKARMRGDIKPLVERFLSIRSMSFENSEQLSGLVDETILPFLAQVDDAIEQFLELTISYSPVLEADRPRIEDSAKDGETVSAFLQVLKLAYPLGELMPLVQSLTG